MQKAVHAPQPCQVMCILKAARFVWTILEVLDVIHQSRIYAHVGAGRAPRTAPGTPLDKGLHFVLTICICINRKLKESGTETRLDQKAASFFDINW